MFLGRDLEQMAVLAGDADGRPPWRLMSPTISLFTLPTKTILATSMVASSVTR